MSKHITIKSTHATISEAVAAAGLDLSYNPQEAARKISDLERGHRGHKSGEAYVTEGNEVYYRYSCDLELLNKFSPFYGVLSDGGFNPVTISNTEITVWDSITLPSGN